MMLDRRTLSWNPAMHRLRSRVLIPAIGLVVAATDRRHAAAGEQRQRRPTP